MSGEYPGVFEGSAVGTIGNENGEYFGHFDHICPGAPPPARGGVGGVGAEPTTDRPHY